MATSSEAQRKPEDLIVSYLLDVLFSEPPKAEPETFQRGPAHPQEKSEADQPQLLDLLVELTPLLIPYLMPKPESGKQNLLSLLMQYGPQVRAMVEEIGAAFVSRGLSQEALDPDAPLGFSRGLDYSIIAQVVKASLPGLILTTVSRAQAVSSFKEVALTDGNLIFYDPALYARHAAATLRSLMALVPAYVVVITLLLAILLKRGHLAGLQNLLISQQQGHSA